MTRSNSRQTMSAYYQARAPIYERVYAYPERQDDLKFLRNSVVEWFSHSHVLEVAAGTGYWTRCISQTAKFVLATDAVPEPLAQIELQAKNPNIQTRVMDAYDLNMGDYTFDAGFAGLWISHLPVQDRNQFFKAFHNCLQPGSRIMLIDNTETQLNRIPIVSTDDKGNTYQERRLDDGTSYQILKNFPSRKEVLDFIGADAVNAEYLPLDHFWMVKYQLPE